MTDIVNPIITVLSPLPGSKNNSLHSNIIFKLDDTSEIGSGVDGYSLDVTINGDYAFNDGYLQAGFDGYWFLDSDINSIQVHVSRDALYTPLESVNVSISARDLSHNPAATRVFSFFTLDNVPPSITNIIPPDLTGQVPSNQEISFSIRTTPRETAIDINTLVVLIGGLEKDAYGDLVLDAYGDPVKTVFVEADGLGQLVYDRRQVSIVEDADHLGYSIVIIPLVSFPLSTKITLDVSIEDLAGNEASSSTSFTTSDDDAPTLINIVPAPSSSSNSIATAVTFTIADQQGTFPGSGIDKNSIQVDIGNNKAIKNGIGQVGFIVDIDQNKPANGYDVTIVPENLFTPRTTVNIRVTASDNNLNVLSTSYVFTTEDVVAPQIIFITPLNGATNVPRSTPLIVDFKSESSVEEIDISSISVSVNGDLAFDNNAFQMGFNGLAIATTRTALTLTVTKDLLFNLGESVTLDAYAADVFGNTVFRSSSFTVTTQIKLKSTATPGPGIFSRSGIPGDFPLVGSYLDVSLITNDLAASIAYTIDGSDPTIDAYYSPTGTTQIYSSAIRITEKNGGVIRFFAFNSSTAEVESINNAIYVFSLCPETETWNDFALRDGLEYTVFSNLKDIQLVDNTTLVAQTGRRVGTASHTHDLGRSSFIDSLNFHIKGTSRFRVRIADALDQLRGSHWVNELFNFNANNLVTLQDGYDGYDSLNNLKINSIGELFRVTGTTQLPTFFADEAKATINEPLLESFVVNADMRLSINPETVVGAKSFIRIRDDSYNLEVQQYISKSSTANVSLTGLNALSGEIPQIFINDINSYDAYDSYGALSDGYIGHIEIVTPSQDLIETFDFISTKIEKIEDFIQLESDTTNVFSTNSFTQSVYNQFIYDDDAYSYDEDGYDGYVYSSSLVKLVSYKRFDSEAQTNFAIPVSGKPLDSTTALLKSENFDDTRDQFIPAETNNTFTTSIFLEAGDYNFRYNVTNGTSTRVVNNPFIFKTQQILSTVQTGDILVVGLKSHPIESCLQISTGEYIIEFVNIFPLSTQDIPTWQILRGQSTVIIGSEKITVDNPSLAVLGEDAQGIVGNLVINIRREVKFSYISSTATNVSVIGTFNNFDTSSNILVEQTDIAEISKIFDANLTTVYENSHLDFHKVTVIPRLPLIVDRVRFATDVSADAYQRTRLLMDEKAVPISNYKSRKQDNTLSNYLSTVDIQSSVLDVYNEWKYVQIGNNLNRTLRKSVGLLTRFDSHSGLSREHLELSIFTIPELPQLTADFSYHRDSKRVYRNNRSDFAIAGNKAVVNYSRQQELIYPPTMIEYVKEAGLINNFIQTNIITSDTFNTAYVEKPYLFKVGDNIITYDGASQLRSTIVEIASDNSGLIICSGTIHGTGIMVKDYKIIETNTNFIAELEVPEFEIALTGLIFDFNPTLTQTTIKLENLFNIDVARLLDGRFTYPLLSKPAKIIESSEEQVLIDFVVRKLIVLVIDQELAQTHPALGAIVEVYNSTKVAQDYIINKSDSSAICLNESELCFAKDVEISYSATIPSYQAPSQMYCFNVDSFLDVVRIRVEPTLSLSLKEIEELSINFFNGVESEAPNSVTFTINDAYSSTYPISSAQIVDGYNQVLFNPAFPATGQILKYKAPIEDFTFDGYLAPFTSLEISFAGEPRYCIGEMQALVDSTLVNSRCRIVLNDEELFLHPLAVTDVSFSRYQIHINRGSLLVYFNGVIVLDRPLLFVDPKVEFGASGKITGDYIVADFKNLSIDQYFTISPAKIQRIGRYIEIEGSVIS